MKQELVLAFNELLEDKQLPREIILDALTEAIKSAYYKSVNTTKNQIVAPEINLDKGEMRIMVEKEVVEDVQDDRTEVSLENARRFNPKSEISDLVMVEVESTPKDFGRVAAQTARQVIQQKIREAEHRTQLDYYQKQLGEIVSGIVQAISPAGLTIGLELKAEGTIQRKDMIIHERFELHQRVRALVTEVKETVKGPQILLSRTHKDFLRRLLENEVPEIFHGVVEIRAIAREPGQRAKVAVSASQQGIDPVGACVGQRGVRIQTIVRELHNEKIDVIEYDRDPTGFIAKAIRPARVSGVYLTDDTTEGKTALVVVPEDQLSLAIGRDGQNARLAAKLTNWRIDIKSLPEAVADWLNLLNNDSKLAKTLDVNNESIQQVEEILARKAEGRVIAPEEYDLLSLFVDKIERKVISQQQSIRQELEKQREEVLQSIPEGAFEFALDKCDLPKKVVASLTAGGYTNVGQLALDVKTKNEKIFNLPGIGLKTIEKIEAFIDHLPKIVPQFTHATPEAVSVSEATDTIEQVEESATTQIEELPVAKEAVEEVAETKVEETPVEPVQELSFDEIFKAESIKVNKPADEEEETTESKESKKKKKRKFREITYDPDLDMTIMHKKHKKGDDNWDWET